MNAYPTRRQSPRPGTGFWFLTGMAVTAVCAVLTVLPRPQVSPAPARPAVPAPRSVPDTPVPLPHYLVQNMEGSVSHVD